MPERPEPDDQAPSEFAPALRTVVSLLMEERTLQGVDPSSLAWDQPVFVLRSAHMERMWSFLNLVRALGATPELHIMSHARDEDAIRALVGHDFTFHPYPAPGRYWLGQVPLGTLEHLKSVGFGSLVFLDAGSTGEGLDEVERLLGAIDELRMVAYLGDGTLARPQEWRRHRLAAAAFYRLIEWYHAKSDPSLGVIGE